MNARQKGKIDLFFGGLASKFESSREFFVGLTWKTVSGRKEYNGSTALRDGKLVYSFAGTKEYDDMRTLLSDLCAVILQYDSAVVEYRERGHGCRVLIDDRNVKLENFEIKEEISETHGLKNKEYNIDLAKAAPLLKRLGFMTADGKIKNDMIRKYNQTDRFLDLVGGMFDGMNDITVVDCACGKSYLSFILNYYLWEQRHVRAKFIGVDIKPNVIEESNKLAADLGYNNMRFVCEDLRTYDAPRADAVISLHACDVATDMALGFAIRHNAKNIICVPCCHKELLDAYKKPDLDPIIKHGVFRARLNDILTDGLRCLKLEACVTRSPASNTVLPSIRPRTCLSRQKKSPTATRKRRRNIVACCRNSAFARQLSIIRSNAMTDFRLKKVRRYNKNRAVSPLGFLPVVCYV